jgi:hypothetical protein
MGAKSRTVLTREVELQGFTKISDPLELHRVLNRAIESAAKVDVRIPGAELGQALKFQATFSENSNIEAGIQIQAPEEIEDDKLINPTRGVNLIAFMRGQNLLCLQAEKAEWKDRTLVVSSPWSAFKLQRRKEARFQIPAAYELIVSMEALEGGRRRTQKRVLDISEHGMGFAVASDREAALYKKGLFLRKMEVKIENRQIFFDGRVANVLPIPSDDLRGRGQGSQRPMKIGIEVIRMSPVDRAFIAAYVARNLVQFYA